MSGEDGDKGFLMTGEDHRGIPACEFIKDVEKYLVQKKGNKALQTAENCVKELQTQYGKYKFMEANLVSQKGSLLKKIPEIKNALQGVVYMKKQQEKEEDASCQFEVSDSVLVNASIKPVDKVLLWLGANVMLEYTYEEAISLLSTNLKHAKENVESTNEDLLFLKDQCTISEVNIARVHNYKVTLSQGSDLAAPRVGAQSVQVEEPVDELM